MRTWRVDDVMTTAVVTVSAATPYREVVDLLVERCFSAVPVVDEHLRVTGVVSEADLLRKIEFAGEEEPRLFEGRRRRSARGKAAARTAADLMSAPAVTVPAGTSVAAAARLMDDESVKRLPVVDGVGRLVGIVSRGDLLKVHLRPDDDIASDVASGVVRPYLSETGESVRVAVESGVVTLTGRVDRWSKTEYADRLIRQIPGVVAVVDELEFTYDDREATGVHLAYGVA